MGGLDQNFPPRFNFPSVFFGEIGVIENVQGGRDGRGVDFMGASNLGDRFDDFRMGGRVADPKPGEAVKL